MKRAILFLTMITMAVNTYAGVHTKRDTTKVTPKKDTVAKKVTPPAVVAKPSPKQFQADPNMVYHIELNVTGQQLVSIIGWIDNSIENTPNITKKQVDDYRTEGLFWKHVMNDQTINQQTAAYIKWAADTGAKPKMNTLQLKGKKIKGKQPAKN